MPHGGFINNAVVNVTPNSLTSMAGTTPATHHAR